MVSPGHGWSPGGKGFGALECSSTPFRLGYRVAATKNPRLPCLLETSWNPCASSFCASSSALENERCSPRRAANQWKRAPGALDGGPSSTAVRHFFRVRLEDHDLRTTACESLRCGTRTATEIEEPDSGSRSDDFTEDLEVCQSLSDAPPLDGPNAQGHRHPLGIRRLEALLLEAAVGDGEALRCLPHRDCVRRAVRDVDSRDRHGLLCRNAHFGRSTRRHRSGTHESGQKSLGPASRSAMPKKSPR